MSTLLLEELYEVESVYRSIDRELAGIREAPELKGLVDAIRAKVNTSIDELEWIRRDVTKGLERFSRRSRRVYRILYTQVLRVLHAAKYRAMMLSQLTNMANFYVYLAANDEYRVSLAALRKFIESAKEHLRDALSLSLYVLVEYEYAVINILREYGVIVFNIPSRDLFRPWKWTLLLHEIGHVLFNARKHFFVTEFRKRIMPLLKQLAPTGMGEELVRGILSLWEQYWLGEFVADLYGVAMGGPAYTHAFMIEVFNSDPSEYIETHPSLDSRMYLQLRYLESIAEIQGLAGSVRELWLSHRKSIVAGELGYPFPSSVLDELNRIFMDATGKPMFLDYMDEVAELREKIDRGEIVVADPLYLVLALTLSGKRMRSDVQKEVIRAIVEGQ